MRNVIVVVADALRADRPSYTGYTRKGYGLTPNLDRLAQDGEVYSRAYSPGPWTFVAQPSLMTGRYASKMGYPNIRTGTRLDGEYSTLGELFKEQGYETRAYNMARMIEGDLGFERGFDYYEDISLKDRIETDFWHMEGMAWNLLFGSDNRTRYAFKSIRRWIKSRDGSNPFFLYWNPTNPHNEYRAPRQFRYLEREVEPWMDEETIDDVAGWGNALDYVAGEADLDEEEMDVVESRYDAEIAYLDHRFGQLLELLEKEGIYEDTVIVFTADHGENFGGHNRLLHHDFGINEALIRVPLVIKGDGFEDPGKPVSTIDLASSVLKAATGEEFLEADSRPALLEGESDREVVMAEREREKQGLIEKLSEYRSLPHPLEWYSRGLKAAVRGDSKLVWDSNEGKQGYRIEGLQEEQVELPGPVEDRLFSELQELDGFEARQNKVEEDIKQELARLGYM